MNSNINTQSLSSMDTNASILSVISQQISRFIRLLSISLSSISLSSISLSSISLLSISLISQLSHAQKKDENIGTEVVSVVKSYTPTISDAFKVKETPTLDDDDTSRKEAIQYTIFSFPVASTFAPSKGKAAKVDKSPEEKFFSNYLKLGAGNYGNLNTELFVTKNINDTDYIGGMLRHNSSQGGIKNVVLSDKFYDTALDVTYGSKTRDLSWNADFGYQHQLYNWYGIYPEVMTETMVDLDAIKEQQTYHTFNFGGKISLADSFFKESSLKFTHFWDAFGSAENRFVVKPSFEFDGVDQKIKTDFVVDYVKGVSDYNIDASNPAKIKYNYTNIGFQPSIKIQKEDLSINAGVGFFYSVAPKEVGNKFYIFPQVTGSYKVVGDLMVLFAGLQGGMKQNSYHDFAQENFFVSPTLDVKPTIQKFDINAGLKGKLTNNVSFAIRGSYKNEENKAFFQSNGYSHSDVNEKGYTFSNSFKVVYDVLKTASLYGELKADFSKNVSFGINGMICNYSTKELKEAWNMPTMKVTTNLDVVISPKWSAGTSVFFVGERKDLFSHTNVIDPLPPSHPLEEVITLKSYFDVNANVDYKHSERLSFSLKGSNLANKNYQRWMNYPVQGIQVMVGASYKFDF